MNAQRPHSPSLSSPGRIILFSAVALVWSAVLIQVYRGVSAGEEIAGSTLSTDGTDAQDFVGPSLPFRGEFRDPFASDVAPLASSEYEVYQDYDYESDDWTPSDWPSAPPPLVLRGVVGSTAMLETQDQEVVLVSEGMSIGETSIVTVERDHVVVQFQGEYHTLLLTADLAESRHY